MLNLQEFLASSAERAATDLVEALLRVPEEKRNWNPEPTSRSALNLVGECAILNGQTADIIASHEWPQDYDFAEYQQELETLCHDWEKMQAMLKENTDKVAAAIRAVPDDQWKTEVQMPWGPMSLADICAYPYWNMTYHMGQTNYIASLLDCLK